MAGSVVHFGEIVAVKTVAIAKVNTVAFVLLGLSLLLTFPPFADLLLGK